MRKISLFFRRQDAPAPAPVSQKDPVDTTAAMYREKYRKANAALTQIIGMETPSCAHIGKRMAAVARNAVAT